ncbi:MAG: biopolymer transporter ExbD [Deltaproteobacteria bacterium]|nr:biopolymer transporter ExbD [Deltaproteobacteria bacterium]
MKLTVNPIKKARIEMLPLIDIVFLLLVFFIYAMLSMAVHRGIPVSLPVSSTATTDKQLLISVTVQPNGEIFVDKEKVPLECLSAVLKNKSNANDESGVLLFADRDISYQHLYKILDQIQASGLERVSLQAASNQQ